MRTSFLGICIVVILVFSADSVLSPNPTNNFTLKNISSATKIILESTGSKFATWSNNSVIQMYSINGSLLCQNKLTQQVQRLVWPSQYFPIVLHFPGKTFSTLNQSTCQIIKTFDFKQVVNLAAESIVKEIGFVWKKGGPYAILSGRYNVFQADLASSKLSMYYGTYDGNDNFQYQTAQYSADGKWLVSVSCDMRDGTRTVRVWNATGILQPPVKEFALAGPVTRLVLAGDKRTLVAVGYSATNDSGHAFRFDVEGNVKGIVSRSEIFKALPLAQGNTVAFFKNIPASLQLVRTGDNSTVQNKTLPTSGAFVDADYVNKVLIVLDSTGRVLTYDYDPDEDVTPPVPGPVKPDESVPFWVIAVAVVAGVIILTFVLMCVFRNKLPKGLREKLPQCCREGKKQQKESLIDKEDKQDQRVRD